MGQPIWTADIFVDAPLAARVIAQQFPELSVKAIEPFGVGWDNAAFLIDATLVFRFPRRRIVAGLIEREIALLPQIAPHLPLAISSPRYIGTASTAYPWAFAGYELIAGSTSCSVVLSDESRAALAEPLGGFLRALHAIEPEPLVLRGLTADEIGRLDHSTCLNRVRERVSALAAAGLATDLQTFAAWLETHPPMPLENDERRLVHGDLYARHVLIDESSRPTGVIDWGDIHFGDPAIDIAIAHLVLTNTAHEAFRNAYGPIDDRTWRAARYRAIYHAILELDYGNREHDIGMREIGLTALRLMRSAVVSDREQNQ